jgi:hypothetical protein
VLRAFDRSFKSIISSPAIERECIKAGVSKAAQNRAMHDEIDRQGLTLKQFCELPNQEQKKL